MNGLMLCAQMTTEGPNAIVPSFVPDSIDLCAVPMERHMVVSVCCRRKLVKMTKESLLRTMASVQVTNEQIIF